MTLFTIHGGPKRTPFYVATRASYVLVNARDEVEARALGERELQNLYAHMRDPLGRPIQIKIQTVREATRDEIRLWETRYDNLNDE